MRALLTLVGNLLRLLLLPVWLVRRAVLRPKGRFVQLRLSASPVELERPMLPWQRLLRRAEAPGMRSIRSLWRLCRLVANDPAIEGLLIELPHLHAGWAVCASVREPIAWLSAQGKRVVVFLPLGGGQRELYVASAATQIVVPPSATLWLLGASAQAFYLKPLLERVGVSAEVFATGEYKTAAESLVRASMSEPQREQLSALADTVQRTLEHALAERPRMNAESARACFERGFFDGAAAAAAGLVDACRYEDELGLELGAKAGALVRWTPAARYVEYRGLRLFRPLRAAPAIGVVAVHGAITDSAPRGPRAPGRAVASFDALKKALRTARRDANVRAVIVHIDSPGGSALASDLVHRELQRVREKKPVIACMGNVAASGGYYIAAGCEQIVAQPVTTTGSIGVISAKVLASELSEHVGVRVDTVRAAPHADMLSPLRALTDDERGMLQRQVLSFYETFLAVVARGRSRTRSEVEALARGRVWSGRDAHARGLVDELGGFERAIELLLARMPELSPRPGERTNVRWIGPAGEAPPIETPGSASQAALLDALALLGDRGAALYFEPAPQLGA